MLPVTPRSISWILCATWILSVAVSSKTAQQQQEHIHNVVADEEPLSKVNYLRNQGKRGISLQQRQQVRKLQSHDIVIETITPTRRLQIHPLTPHHVRYPGQDVRRRLDRPAQNWTRTTQTSPPPLLKSIDALYQGYGTHYVDLWVGTPPQRQTVIVDTGSSVTAFPCSDCTNCGMGYHVDNYFQEELSATFQDVDCAKCWLGKCSSTPLCEVAVSYQEGSSWRAYEVSDIVYSGGPHAAAIVSHPARGTFRMHFGCQTHLTGLFKTQLADGIMGMEMASTSYWRQMHTSKSIHDAQFSLCFSRQPVASKDGTGAGAMTMGGTDGRLHQTPMVFVSQPNNHGWYTVRLRNLYLRTGGGERVAANNPAASVFKVQGVTPADLNNGDVIVDSGTTDTYLSTRLLGSFSAAWKLATGVPYDNEAHALSDEQLLALPTILIQIEGWKAQPNAPNAPGLATTMDPTRPNDVIVAMPPTHYMEYSLKSKKYTSRVYFNEGRGGVLGANFMMGHDILFDVDNGRIGVAESECDYSLVKADEEAA